MANKTQNILTAAVAVAIGCVTFSCVNVQSARADDMAGSTAAGMSSVAGNSTRALIDLRGARALLNLPEKQYMTEADWASVDHISKAIKSAEQAGMSDGQHTRFTPMTAVTTPHEVRLWKARKLVQDAQNELGADTSSPVGSEINSSLKWINRAIAAENWRTYWSNDWNQPGLGRVW